MQEKLLSLTELTAITPLDGRYRDRIAELSSYVSEYSLIRTRLEIEARYLVALSDSEVIRPFSPEEKNQLHSFGQTLSLDDAKLVKKTEEETRHDVKAMERIFRTKLAGTSLEDVTEMIHFGLTSEDVNNLSFRLMLKRATRDISIPKIDTLIDTLLDKAEQYKKTPMLARTHGQAAIPTTIGKELAVFATRLNGQVRQLENQQLTGKLTGAVGNLNALHTAFPNTDWISFSENFVQSLGLKPNLITTQINSYEDVVSYFQNYQRINNILIDFNQDMWRYISDHWFVQEVKKGEVGSSTMPQKVNPIDFENSEGNLGISNALIEHFTRKLPVSRLQRDLSDSTVMRNIGTILAYSLIGYKSVLIGLLRIRPNEKQISNDLNLDWAILTEAVQTILRSSGVSDPYSLIASLSRGKQIDSNAWKEWIHNLPIDAKQKELLQDLTPQKYIGLAVELTTRAIKDIKTSRKR